MINLLIVDDDFEWISIVRSILKMDKDINIIDSISSPMDVIKIIENNDEINMILMDFDLTNDEYNGVKLTERILKIKFINIIMLTCVEKKDIVVDSFFAGAVNYLYKRDISMLKDTIKSTYLGKSPFQIMGKKAKEYSKEIKKYETLNRSEKQIFDLKLEGKSISQIATELTKSVNTIKSQLNKLYKKFGVKNFESLKKKIYEID
jgi:DNA-binding NarL/FixJ family response regulator